MIVFDLVLMLHMLIIVLCSLQNLPLSYSFAYVISGSETAVLCGPQLSSITSEVRLPQGDPSRGNTVFVVAYVTNALGFVARCTTGVDGTGPVNVTSVPLVTDDIVQYVLHAFTPLLVDTAAQSKHSIALSNVIVLSTLLTSYTVACHNIVCNFSDVCLNGTCVQPAEGTSSELCGARF